ncbi:hypothetical protein [Ancylobacter amanitiformis]|uniref:Uncharacterized protein n=1 Tax=Ancylobacter amanitiformis TaxID=217069 RepID=A0ABU0LQE4_9HYPH|nr:hypothetical protein [Ancylobacter amanitiformis]MDQ0510899.1 hypothetical protein [Ancylobacter amanitiformis]
MDTAFYAGAFPAYTSAELRRFIAEGAARSDAMRAEIERREAVEAGDLSRATPGENLDAARRHAESGRESYEASLRQRPNYPGGRPRRTWGQLDDVARWSWTRDQSAHRTT